ncbi:nucleoside phosphatase GDA1/CD39 [Syncephalis pseudoplumigaleata]|uniref:guanosine-diphosphatase n=1 Tax=Syncephalis pseudoplumigaleata TaxID=1712513 RepID=A0A4P9YWP6_9FUNG|nr:nucleoside phosphatase GDA1/CD39 [Syncephalis pseudoplumigaleata]|eukprot:RKP24285.1 nucleoside phosphatase GDA1/CD39 [Syncephalis pseudoplumigaleata]
MIDAGSTGSRIHAYRFNYCAEQPRLESEVFHHIKPGLSSFPDDPVAAAHSLDELMAVALASVPASLHGCTPVAVKATAGLRLLGATASDAILAQVRHHLATHYPFPLVQKEGVAIMDGKDEGVYAWITVNYLLDNLTAHERASTAAIFDLGGGSTQIVFEPAMPVGKAMAPGEHEYALQFASRDYLLYQHSYLGFGLMEARRRILQYNIHNWQKESGPDGRVEHPCLPVGYHELLPAGSGDPAHAFKAYPEADKSITLTGAADGLEQCRAFIRRLLFDKDPAACPIKPCAFDGVYQPSLQQTFDHGHLYVFSYFYDRLDDLGFDRDFTLQDVRDAAHHVCRQDAAWLERERGVANATRLFEKNAYYCMDMAFIYGLLRDGYEVPDTRQVHMAKKIKGFETGWCVGAAIAVLDEGHYCRVQEV